MKTKFLFASLVASAVMVGCSNEELPVADNAAGDKSALIFGGFEDQESRMAYDGANGTFKWQVGDEIGVSRVSGKEVTTNYLFEATKVHWNNTDALASWTTTSGAADKYAYFETEFGSIFKGNYVVYYPYDENFCEDGKIVAKLNVGQVEISTAKTEHVAADGFMMSPAVAFEGGQKAEKFPLYPVFGRLVLKIKSTNGSKIETIVLRSLNGATLPTEMEIDADINVVNGKLNPAFMHVVESSKVEEIVLAVDNASNTLAGSSDATAYTAYFTLIPGTYTNFAIDVVTDKGTYTKTFANATIGTGDRVNVPLSFGSSDMVLKRTYYAASAESWKTAIEKLASMTVSEASPATIKVVNDIELDGTNTLRPSANDIHDLIPVTVVGSGSIKIPSAAMTTSCGSLKNMTFEVPVEADIFQAWSNETVKFAAGLKAGNFVANVSTANYTVEGGKIGTLTVNSGNQVLTVNDVTFTGLVNVNLTSDISSNGVTKVNFNDCTFQAGLTNTAGDITVVDASIVRPNTWSSYSELNVNGGAVYMKGANTVNDVDVTGVLHLNTNATAAINHELAAITGTINVNKDATLTLGSSINYVLDNKIKVEGKLVNNGRLTASAGAVIDDMTQNNHKGILENNGVVRVSVAAYNAVWYNNQNITFTNNANYDVYLESADHADFPTYVAKQDVTGIEFFNESTSAITIELKGRGNDASVFDFSDKNLILNAYDGDINSSITNGLTFKNIEVKGTGNVEFTGVSDGAKVTTGNLNVNGKFTLGGTLYNNSSAAKATNITVGTAGELSNGARAQYTGSFTNNGTVRGGNPTKVQ